MRKLIGFDRNFNFSLLAVMPTRGTCLHVLESAAPELPTDSESLVRSLVDYSHAERIVTEADPAIPPKRSLELSRSTPGAGTTRPPRLVRQRGDWRAIVELGEQVEQLGLKPLDRSEWMPFFQGYINLGMDEPAELAAVRIWDHEKTRHSLCDHLTQAYFADEEFFLRGQELLCSFDATP